MADNNKNGYSTGGNDAFDLFSAFDSAPVIQPEPKPEPVKEVEVKSETEKENKPEEKAEIKKKSPLFTVLCIILCVAILVCGCVSGLNVAKKLKPVNTDVQTVDNENYNIYADMIAKYKKTTYPTGIQKELVKAYAANNDLVGWLYIPDTAVNTPIVQGKDNTKYLRNNFYGENTRYGTAYADYRCKKHSLSTNHVIYGHNMPSGTHFYDINRYEDIEWYKQHPVIKYSTLTGEYTYLVYAAFYTTALIKYNGGYFFNYIYPNMGPVSLKGYIQQINERAIYKTGVTATSSDKFITLSTCNHSLDSACGVDIDGRLVVVGRLLRNGESESVDTSAAKSNPNYRRPQVWYDRKGKTNPYAKSVTWIPSEK